MKTSSLKQLYFNLSRQINPASLIVAVACDLLWSIPEGALTASWVGIIFLPIAIVTIFIACFGAVTLIQHFSSGDEWSNALLKGLVLGILAAIPYSFVGLAAAGFWGIMRLTYGVDQETILLGKLARGWREIEVTLRRLAPPELRGGGIEDVINALYARHFLSGDLKDQLHELRKQRNIAMHEISTAELTTLVDEVQAMQNTLRARFLRP